MINKFNELSKNWWLFLISQSKMLDSMLTETSLLGFTFKVTVRSMWTTAISAKGEIARDVCLKAKDIKDVLRTAQIDKQRYRSSHAQAW